MSTFPTTLDTYADIDCSTTTQPKDVINALQDAVELVEAKVGVDSSAVTSSHDYKLSGVTGSDKAVSKTGTEALTNKTLTSPVITNKTSTGTDSGTETLGSKTLASPVINTSISGTAFLDEDTLSSNSDTKVASQQSIKAYMDNTATALRNAPQGFLLNGKIVPSVTSNNLTVAIKGLDGNDPSSSNPVYVRIGDTVRSIITALSVTTNAATNWFNAGSSEFATKEIDYFVYLGYNATDGVVIGFSRMPYAQSYSQFSATSTNRAYCAISDISNAAATDYYELVGRFAATLSAGAGYTWAVPTFTAINLIQKPTYETRVLRFVPTMTSGGGAYTNIPTILGAYYKIIHNQITWALDYTYNATSGGSGASLFSTGILPVISFPAYGGRGDGKMLVGQWYVANGTIYVTLYDATSPISNGVNCQMIIVGFL